MANFNFFRKIIEDLTANSKTRINELNEEFEARNKNRLCNFLYVRNNADNLITIELGEDENQRFEIASSGGTFIINRDDNITYDKIAVVEENGNTVTGKIVITGGVL